MWKARFGLDIVNGVGSTEMGHLFLTNLPDAVEYGTAGRAVKGYDLRLVDEIDREIEDEEVGELLVRGESAAAGYWNQRQRSRRTFQGEWTRTGDKYLRRADGVYVYVGRTDDMFKVSGIWVSPFEVEAALVMHESVLEAAVETGKKSLLPGIKGLVLGENRADDTHLRIPRLCCGVIALFHKGEHLVVHQCQPQREACNTRTTMGGSAEGFGCGRAAGFQPINMQRTQGWKS